MVFLELWWHRSHCHKYMKGLEGGKKDLRRKKNALGRKEGLNKALLDLCSLHGWVSLNREFTQPLLLSRVFPVTWEWISLRFWKSCLCETDSISMMFAASELNLISILHHSRICNCDLFHSKSCFYILTPTLGSWGIKLNHRKHVLFFCKIVLLP